MTPFVHKTGLWTATIRLQNIMHHPKFYEEVCIYESLHMPPQTAYNSPMNPNDTIFNQTIGTWLSHNAWLIVILLIWSIFWKGLALWRSARREDKVWFVLLLIINTAGILEILYYFYFSRPSARAKDTVTEPKVKPNAKA